MEETEMKKRKKRRRGRRGWGAGMILMLVLKLLASFVMTAFEKRYEELGFGESAEETGTFITKPEKLTQNQVNAKLKKMAEQLPKIKEIYDNREQYSEHLLSLVCNNPEMADFVRNYNDAEHIAEGGLTRKEKMQQIPLLLKWDKRWGLWRQCIGAVRLCANVSFDGCHRIDRK